MVVGEMPESRDLVVIGGGPGGIAAALAGIRAGRGVTLVDDGGALGGALPGLVEPASPLEPGLLAQGIEVLHGRAAFTAEHTVRVVRENLGAAYLEFDSCVIATGAEWDESTTAVALATALDSPHPVTVSGTGMIALVTAGRLHRAGVPITLALDPGRSSELHRAALLATARHLAGHGVTVSEVTAPAPATERIGLGRHPRTAGLDLGRARIRVDDHGAIRVGPDLLAAPRIAAIGDATSGAPTAHRAVSQAEVAVAALGGRPAVWDALVPVLLTIDLGDATLEAASVGVDPATRPSAHSRVLTAFWQAEHRLVYEAGTRILLGASSVGPGAVGFIAGLTAAVEAGLTVDDVTHSAPPYPLTTRTIDRPWAEKEPL
jgi:dihydrolipoamide dehydrogenase